jgi:hypothetical protein
MTTRRSLVSGNARRILAFVFLGAVGVSLQTSDAEGKPKKKVPAPKASASASASAARPVPAKGARKPTSGTCNNTDEKCQGNGESCSNNLCFCTEEGYQRCGKEEDVGFHCANVQLDEDNCGACGKRCRDSQMCEKGKCVAVQCDPGETSCRAGCRDLKTDDDNCGACLHACARDMGFTCSNGRCTR